MIRRTFIDRILSLLSGLLLLPFNIWGAAGEKIKLQSGKGLVEIPARMINGNWFLPLVSFSEAAGYGHYTNDEKRKTVVYIGHAKIKFASDNSFVILNDDVIQVLIEPIWVNREIWVPAALLADLVSKNTSVKMTFEPSSRVFKIDMKDVNIAGLKVDEKSNGSLIQIIPTRTFTERDIHLKKVNGWFYVEIYGAKTDSLSLNRRYESGLISEVKVVQFDQSASLAFKLRHQNIQQELVLPKDSQNILITLRSKEPLENKKDEREKLDQQKDNWRVHTIVIDAGHGGRDPGAIGYGRVYEKNIVLPVALKLGAEIKKRLPRVKVVYTRKTDVFIPLYKRTKIANENNGKLFISLHCNWNPNKSARGFETFFLSSDKDARARDVVLKENESINFESNTEKKRYQGVNFVLATMAQNAFIKQSQYFATLVQKALAARLRPYDLKSRGVKQGPFWVMVGATMPNVLIEMGFISNKHEAKQLQRKATQSRLASAICDGIEKYKTDIEGAM